MFRDTKFREEGETEVEEWERGQRKGDATTPEEIDDTYFVVGRGL